MTMNYPSTPFAQSKPLLSTKSTHLSTISPTLFKSSALQYQAFRHLEALAHGVVGSARVIFKSICHLFNKKYSIFIKKNVIFYLHN